MVTPLPTTLATASVLAVMGTVLAARAAMLRVKSGILFGDGGNQDLITRMRAHANFVEYVPLLLIMMALLEVSGANRAFLAVTAVALVLARVLHAIGMTVSKPNFYRATGTAGTTLLVLLYAGYGLAIVYGHWWGRGG